MPMFRAAFLAACLCTLFVAEDNASAAMIGFSAQIQTNQDGFSILNTSDAGFSITALAIDLGDNAQFDTGGLSLTSTSDLSFSPSLATAVIDEASTALFDFAGFDAGETFSFDVGFLNAAGATAVGADLNNALITVTFNDGQTLQTTFAGGPTSPPTSSRQSFMFNASGTAGVGIAEIPAPSSVWLFALGIVAASVAGAAHRRCGNAPD